MMQHTTGDRVAGGNRGEALPAGQKQRVYELAKDLGVDQKVLVDKVRSLGIEVKNHMSSLEPDDVARIKRSFEKERQENTVTERLSATVIRRRNKAGPGQPAMPQAISARPEVPAPRVADTETIVLPERTRPERFEMDEEASAKAAPARPARRRG